ncbi:MAG TPA: hypothetical protein PK752_14750 [Accumulibacter sp.]|uniref:hypothetical protein n=1 Tax=Accumulibacter sp. TaxID=2053492 RepID=UPI002C72A4DB|nr:hypothetical protein [Accumulibacter sp.]HRD89494.1 hypothetical protein [Accumulibacter sp.]
MDQVIIEVVLGLVLIYITLALLAMKVQEMLAGGLLKRRVRNLHNLVYEAVGQDAELQGKLFENALIFPLFQGSAAKKNNVLPSKGPSEIPPALFARAMLMVLNAGRHPSEEFGTPSNFLSAREAEKNPPKALSTLRALAAGREASWPDLEAAIARWYDDIGDRSKGWFQRESQLWALGIALLMAGLLNVDSFYIAQKLSTDPALRSGVANLAESLNTQFQASSASDSGGSAPATRTTAPSDKATLVSARMVDAITRLNDAFKVDKEIALFRFRENDARTKCKGVLDHVPPPSKPKKDSGSGDSSLSDSVVWLRVLPNLKAKIEVAELDSPDDSGSCTNDKVQGSARTKCRLQEAYICLSYVSAWVTSAITASADPTVRTRVQEAAVALEASKAGLLAMIERQAPVLSFKQLFHADPQTFEECASGSEVSRSSVQECLARALVRQVRLPIGFGHDNTRQQFCEATVNCAKVNLVEPATLRKEWHDRWCRAEPVTAKPWYDPCTGNDFSGNAALGIPPLSLQVRAGAGLEWLLGVIVTSFFVALGAPFWFDVLGKVVNLRSAGRAREEAENTARGQGSAPTPPPSVAAAAGSSETAPFSPSLNRFEEQLVARDIVALQQRVDAEATGQLDRQTRSKIAAYCEENKLDGSSDQLSWTLFERIVGRNPVNVPVIRPSARMVRGQTHEQVAEVAGKLMAQLDFPDRIAAGETKFTDDLRALAVLYRYKKERADKPNGNVKDLATLLLARSHPAVLNELDEALIAEIIEYRGKTPRFARERAAWLDWAIGEIGQVEVDRKTRSESNPRICEYLDVAEANAGNSGDHTPWCGAFVAWVLNRYIATLTNAATKKQLQPPKDPLTAISWHDNGWGTERPRDQRQPGDVVVVRAGTGHHVGFLLANEIRGAVQLLGGNQAKGTSVCLSRFPAEDIVAVRGVS